MSSSSGSASEGHVPATSGAVFEALVVRPRRTLSGDFLIDRGRVLRYLAAGTYVGIGAGPSGSDVWTDGYWVWDSAEVYYIANEDWVPADVEFLARVDEVETPAPVEVAVLDGLARVMSVRRGAESSGRPWRLPPT